MTKEADGQWRVEPPALPVAGTWRAQIALLISHFEMAKLEGEIRIEQPGVE